MKQDTPFIGNDITLDGHDFLTRGKLELPWGPGPLLPTATMYRADKLDADSFVTKTEARLTIEDSDGEVAHLIMTTDQMRSFADWIFMQADEISAEIEAEAGEQ